MCADMRFRVPQHIAENPPVLTDMTAYIPVSSVQGCGSGQRSDLIETVTGRECLQVWCASPTEVRQYLVVSVLRSQSLEPLSLPRHEGNEKW